MKQYSFHKKLLAGLLCASMVFQHTSVCVYAADAENTVAKEIRQEESVSEEESEDITEERETTTAIAEEAETQMPETETAGEAETEASQVSETETAEEVEEVSDSQTDTATESLESELESELESKTEEIQTDTAAEVPESETETQITEEVAVMEAFGNETAITELRLDTNTIRITGIGRKAVINAEIIPAEAIDERENITVASSNENVAVIEIKNTENGLQVTLTSVGFGSAVIQFQVNNTTIQECSVTVSKANFSEEERALLKQNLGTIYAITNVAGNRLGNVGLPEGWSWVKPDTTITADDNVLNKYYEVRYTKEGYNSFTEYIPVTITEITGFSISGAGELTSRQTGSYKINLNYKGYHVESNSDFKNVLESVVGCTWSADSRLNLNHSTGWSVDVTATAVDEVAEGVLTAEVTVGDHVFTEDYAVVILAEHITQITIVPQTADKTPVKYQFEEDEQAVYIEESNVTDKSNTIKLEAIAESDGKTVAVQKGVLQWEINDESLAEMKENADGTVLLTILKSGTIVVRATAADVGLKYTELVIEVRDYTPILESSSFVVNKYDETGVELPIYAVEGNEITKVLIEDASFRVERQNGKFLLSIADKTLYTNNTTVETKLVIRTQMSSNLEQTVKVNIDTQKPKITFKAKSAPNIFYTDAEAVYTVNSAYDIVSIRNESESSSGFYMAGYDAGTGLLTLKVKGLNANTVSDFRTKNSDLCKVHLLVTYDQYGTHSEVLTITPKVIKPSYKVKEITTTAANSDNSTYITDSSGKNEVKLAETTTVQSATTGVSVEKSGGRLSVKNSENKTKSYKITLSDPNWTGSLTLSGKITTVKKLSTLLGANKIILNMAHNQTDNGNASLTVSVKNNLSAITNVNWKAADKKTQQLLDSGYLKVSYDSNNTKLLLGLEAAQTDIKPGNYKLKVTAVTGRGESQLEMQPANLTLSLVSAAKKPTVKLTGKGSINLVDRANTNVLYTPKLTNMTAKITGVETTGEYAGYFKAQLADGKIEVKAVQGMVMNTTTSYPVGIKMEFDNNTTVTTNVKIKPVNKLPKIKADSSKGTIYKVSANEMKWSVYNAGTYGEIEKIQMVENKASQYFTMTQSDNNTLTLKLTSAAKRTIKKGKYTISYQVTLKDAAINAKPVTLKMTITVK